MPRRSAADESETVSLTKARTKSETLRAAKLAQEVKKREGTLVDVAEAQRHWGRVGEIIRDGFLSLPSRVALKCAGKSAREIQVVLQAEVSGILQQMPERIMPS